MAQDSAKKVLILGGDGYLGWPTAMYLTRLGYKVAAVDSADEQNGASRS